MPAFAATGTSTDPFTSLAEAYAVPAAGRYHFNLGSGQFQADVDTSEGGGWVLVLQYVHQGGTNPGLTILGAGANLPVTSTAALGTSESGVAARWGHAGTAAMSQFGGDIETRWFGRTSGHSRVVHFRTSVGNSYFRTGTGSMSGLSAAFTALTGHTAFTPGTAGAGYTNKGSYAFTNFPFYEGGARHWGIRAEGGDNVGGSGANGNRWEMDDFANDFSRSTIHRIWVRAANPGTVTNTADSGAGSLRDAIKWANATSSFDTIVFNIPGAGPHTITLSSVLPSITDDELLIDGLSQSGSQCGDIWSGAAHSLRINVRPASRFDGFRLAGANQYVLGLSLTGFENAIETLAGSSGATIQCNYLGLLTDGTSSGNSRGVEVAGASARIGGLAAGEGNVISGNLIAGIVSNAGSTDTSVQGNFIGTDPTGMSARANGTAVNHWFGAATWRDFTRNLISGNTSAGIVLETDDQIAPSTDLIRIQRNRIGFTRTLSARLANGGDGIRFPAGSATNVLIGGLSATEGNEITGTVRGIALIGVSNMFVRGNTIARSGGVGVYVENVNTGSIGGDAGTLGNIIGGNSGRGIHLLGGTRNVTVLGNTIGAVTITGATFENQSAGIFLDTVTNITIGNGTASGRNLISRNGGRAINGIGTSSNVTIDNNYIGTDATGNVAVTNAANEGATTKDAISFDQGGTFTNLSIINNVIGGHEAAQIELFGSAGSGITIQGNNIGVGANGTSQIVPAANQQLVRIGGGGAYSNMLIGGTGAGQGNILAFGNQSGLLLDTTGSNIQVIGNTIRNNTRDGIELLNSTNAAIISNRIFDNGLLGIDLSDNGVTANDTGDGDSGPNNLLNFPQITSINITGANQLIYSVTLDVPSDANGYRIEFFANSAADSSGFGEGERYLGFVDIAHAGGVRSFAGTLTTLVPVAIGNIVSATATRRTAGGAWDITSEFSATATALGAADLTVQTSSAVFEPPSTDPLATPLNDVVLTTTISNVGTGSTDVDSIFAVVTIEPATSFYNAVTAAFGGVVGFTSQPGTLTFTPATDLRFSNATSAPTALAQCTYTPAAGYDPQVRHLCLNPKGVLPSGSPGGQFTVQLRARIN